MHIFHDAPPYIILFKAYQNRETNVNITRTAETIDPYFWYFLSQSEKWKENPLCVLYVLYGVTYTMEVWALKKSGDAILGCFQMEVKYEPPAAENILLFVQAYTYICYTSP